MQHAGSINPPFLSRVRILALTLFEAHVELTHSFPAAKWLKLARDACTRLTGASRAWGGNCQHGARKKTR